MSLTSSELIIVASPIAAGIVACATAFVTYSLTMRERAKRKAVEAAVSEVLIVEETGQPVQKDLFAAPPDTEHPRGLAEALMAGQHGTKEEAAEGLLAKRIFWVSADLGRRLFTATLKHPVSPFHASELPAPSGELHRRFFREMSPSEVQIWRQGESGWSPVRPEKRAAVNKKT